MTRRKLCRWFVALLGTSFVTLGVIAWVVAGSLVAPVNRVVGPPPESLPATSTTLESDSGASIATWCIDAHDATATIILLHPIRGDRRSMLGRAQLLHNAGYSVVMIDMQAHGQSSGDHITVGHLEQHDVKAAVEYVRKQKPTHRIGIIGQSDLRPIDHIADAGCPILIASGDLDKHTSISETRRLFEAANEPKELVVFPNAGHVDLFTNNTRMYQTHVLAFLDRHLRPANEAMIATPTTSEP